MHLVYASQRPPIPAWALYQQHRTAYLLYSLDFHSLSFDSRFCVRNAPAISSSSRTVPEVDTLARPRVKPIS